MIIRIDKYDRMYPIKIEDGWGGVANIHLWTIENNKDWENFITKLNKTREKYLKNLQKNT
jgi:hypothetical protein